MENDKYKEKERSKLVNPEHDSKGEIPPGVQNEEAWYKWTKLQEDYLSNDDFTQHQTSDPLVIIDLKTTMNVVRSKTKHLPKEEREEIEKRAKAVRVLMGKGSALKAKAFGVRQGGYYTMSESMLDPRAGELIEYFGRFYSAKEVQKIVVDDWGYPCSMKQLQTFRKNNLDKIKERQEEYKRDYSDIRLGYKRSRLEELEWLYKTRKDKYEATQSQQDYRLLLQTLDAIKKEVEVDVLRIEGDINHKIETTINVHVQQELFKDMTINDIIVARVAAKQGLNSAFLIERLHKSFYARHSGFGTGDRHIHEEEVQYPSTIVYNWGEIEKMHREEKDKLNEQKKPLEITDTKVVQKSQSIKDALMARIKQSKKDVNRSQSRVDEKDEE